MDISKYDRIIRSYARRFQNEDDGVEDLEQLGRIAVWKELTKHPDAPNSHVSVAIKDAMIHRNRALRAQKRKPRGGLTSLSAAFSPEDDRTLEDVLGKEDPGFVLQTELLDTLLQGLNQRYGYRYVVGMQTKESQPWAIVKNIVRSLIEDIAGIPKGKIPQRVNFQLFKDAGLERMLWVYYGNSPFHAVMDAYEGEFLPWDFARKPQRFWKGKKGLLHVQDALTWFCAKHNIHSIEDCKNITGKDFEESGLDFVCNTFFHGSPYLALQTKFPDLAAWQMGYTPTHYFDTQENQRKALTSFLLHARIPLLEELDAEQTYDAGIRLVVSKDAICNYGLRGLLAHHGNSPYTLFKRLYPSQILPWTLMGKKQWRENPRTTAGDAVRWLFDKYLNIPQRDIPEYATFELFRDIGFGGIITNLNIGFNSSPFAAVDNAYPEKFSKEQFTPEREIVYLPQRGFRKAWKGR